LTKRWPGKHKTQIKKESKERKASVLDTARQNVTFQHPQKETQKKSKKMEEKEK